MERLFVPFETPMVRTPGHLPPTTRRRFLATTGATLAVAALPGSGAAAAADSRAPLTRAQRRTVRALLEADLPAGTPRSRLSAGRAAIDERYARASTAGRAELRRLLAALDGSPDGDRAFSDLDRDARRTLLRNLGADREPEVLDFGSAQAFADFVELERAAVATASAVAGLDPDATTDFAEVPAGSAPDLVRWRAKAADPGAALRADVRTALDLVRAALETVDRLDEL